MLAGLLLFSLLVQDASARLSQAQELMRLQAFAEAEPVLEELTQQEPASSRGHYYLGVCRMRLGKINAAIAALESARSLAPQPNPVVLFELGSAYLQSSRPQDAVDVLEPARKLAPREIRIRLQLGWAYYQLVEGEKAASEFVSVIEQEPSNPQAHFYLGMAEAALGDLDAAQGSFRRAIQLDPTLVDARLALARVLSQSGRHDEAKAELESVLRSSPSGASSAHSELGLIASRSGDTEAAVKHFEAVVSADPEHRQATYHLWLLYQRSGRAAEAAAMRARFEALSDQPSKEPSLSRASRRKPNE